MLLLPPHLLSFSSYSGGDGVGVVDIGVGVTEVEGVGDVVGVVDGVGVIRKSQKHCSVGEKPLGYGVGIYKYVYLQVPASSWPQVAPLFFPTHSGGELESHGPVGSVGVGEGIGGSAKTVLADKDIAINKNAKKKISLFT